MESQNKRLTVKVVVLLCCVVFVLCCVVFVFVFVLCLCCVCVVLFEQHVCFNKEINKVMIITNVINYRPLKFVYQAPSFVLARWLRLQQRVSSTPPGVLCSIRITK